MSPQKTVAGLLSWWLVWTGARCCGCLARGATFDRVGVKMAYIVFACAVLVYRKIVRM